MSVAIVHPTLTGRLPGFFPSLCTVEGKTVALDSYGQETETWATWPGSAPIPCAKAPLNAIERQAAQYTATDQAYHVLLKGAFPEITTRHRVIVDGDTFDIDASETDQTTSLTRLRVRSVAV